MRFLMVFDFDHTLVDENSDLWVVRSVTKGFLFCKLEENILFHHVFFVLRCLPDGRLPASIENSHRGGLWMEYMCRVMKFIGERRPCRSSGAPRLWFLTSACLCAQEIRVSARTASGA